MCTNGSGSKLCPTQFFNALTLRYYIAGLHCMLWNTHVVHVLDVELEILTQCQ